MVAASCWPIFVHIRETSEDPAVGHANTAVHINPWVLRTARTNEARVIVVGRSVWLEVKILSSTRRGVSELSMNPDQQARPNQIILAGLVKSKKGDQIGRSD